MIVLVATQPVFNLYVTVIVPVAAAVSIPLDEIIVAIEELLLLHVPPVVASLSGVDERTQISACPEIVDGSELIVIFLVVIQPVPSV